MDVVNLENYLRETGMHRPSASDQREQHGIPPKGSIEQKF
jgi:hypothetical protein